MSSLRKQREMQSDLYKLIYIDINPPLLSVSRNNFFQKDLSGTLHRCNPACNHCVVIRRKNTFMPSICTFVGMLDLVCTLQITSTLQIKRPHLSSQQMSCIRTAHLDPAPWYGPSKAPITNHLECSTYHYLMLKWPWKWLTHHDAMVETMEGDGSDCHCHMPLGHERREIW